MSRIAPLFCLIFSMYANPALATSCPQEGSIAIRYASVEAPVAAQLGLEKDAGVLVIEVYEGGPADRAGLRRYDVITHVDGKAVKRKTFSRMIRSKKVGSKVNLRVLRTMRPLDVVAVVEKKGKTKRKKAQTRRTIVRNRIRSRSSQSGCMPAPSPMTRDIKRMRDIESKIAANARRHQRDIRRIEREDRNLQRNLRDMERDMARKRAKLERELARMEARVAQERSRIEQAKRQLAERRSALEAARKAAEAERLAVEQEQKKLREKQKEIERREAKQKKRREIL